MLVSVVGLPRDIRLTPRHDERLLGGVTVLEGEARVMRQGDWSDQLYRELPSGPPVPHRISLIPYYAWANRGVSEMTVWMPLVQ
jgi:DUF1680 family protein